MNDSTKKLCDEAIEIYECLHEGTSNWEQAAVLAAAVIRKKRRP